jgi:hypothetical protein
MYIQKNFLKEVVLYRVGNRKGSKLGWRLAEILKDVLVKAVKGGLARTKARGCPSVPARLNVSLLQTAN